MTVLFRRMAVVGLGLVGGSVAAAARERGVVGTVVGSARRKPPLERAVARGTIDEALPAMEAVRDADLVVLATPVSAMATVLREVADGIGPGALVTDVGSVKGPLVDTLRALLPPGVHFVGSHPMAGSHETGVDHARADLFDGACCVVTPAADTDAGMCDRLVGFWEALGARVVLRDPAAHDHEVAWVSHLPHAVAFAYAHALGCAPEAAAELAGSGFHDFVRIARSDSDLWADILGMNRPSLVRPLRAFGKSLEELSRAIENDDRVALERILASAASRLALVAMGRRDGQTAAPNSISTPDPGA